MTENDHDKWSFAFVLAVLIICCSSCTAAISIAASAYHSCEGGR